MRIKNKIAIVSSLMFGATGVGITTINIAKILIANGHEIYFITSMDPGYSSPNLHPVVIKPKKCLKSIQWSIGHRLHLPFLHKNATAADIDVIKFSASVSKTLDQIIRDNNIELLYFIESYLEYIFFKPSPGYQILLNLACPRYMFQKLGIINDPVNNYLFDKDSCFMKHVNKFSTPSKAMAALAVDYYKLFDRKIKVIPNPVDISVFFPKQTKISQDSIGLCFSGRFSREKGADSIIEIIPPLMREFKNLSFSVAGSDSIDSQGRSRIERLKNLLSDSNCIDRFKWFPFIKYIEMPEFYHNHSIFISPTMFESFGNTLAEAQACGLPVVSCKVGGVPEVVLDKTTGFLEDVSDNKALSDRVRELITDGELRERMGANAASRARDLFSFSTIASKYEDLVS